MKRFLLLIVMMFTMMLIISINSAYAGSSKSPELLQKNTEIQTGQEASSISGKVVETMDAGAYTYVSIEKGGKKIWVAVPKMKVTVGQEISFVPGMVMNDFTSKTLNRTFESIVFSSGAMGQESSGAAQGSSSYKQVESAQKKVIKVEKASGTDAYTVAELYEKNAELDKKKVVIRGRVVKVSPGIMGKNWIHLQDGSGSASSGTNDILVTSQDTASVGDVVTAKGTLYKDKDFGSGYKYAVIVEEASFSK